MKDKNIAIEATYWYSLLEKIERDNEANQNTPPVMKKLIHRYVRNELKRIKKEIEREFEEGDGEE